MYHKSLSIFAVILFSSWLIVPTVAGGNSPVIVDEFELKDFDPAGGLYYKMNREQSTGIVEFQSRDVRFGKGALSLTVQPFCKPGEDECSERAEVWMDKKTHAAYEEPVWYAFSVKLADPVPTAIHRYVMAQWKRRILVGAKTPYSPFLALRLNKGKFVFTVETDRLDVQPIGEGARKEGCLPGETWVLDREDDKQTRALISKQADMEWGDWRHFNGCTSEIKAVQHTDGLPKASDGWADFAFFVKTGPTGNGRIEIFANGVHVTTVTGKIGHRGAGLGDNQYFKFGPYRAGKSDNWTVIYDRFRRGPKCTDVTDKATCSTRKP
ncbi:FIG01074908: hypothetical protein [hydrothermal vent metagenome]|uniref:Polysaccharide lyase-like protein n=1 Tax=hydrothermal vent metagenome TaxID=652676 RepID=A0A3B0SJH0_9ZZZZ